MRSVELLFPEASRGAVEINERACSSLRDQDVEVTQASLLEFSLDRAYDLVLTIGVLIHIEPSRLIDAYRCIYAAADRLILIAEYYSPYPVEVPYRGHSGALWKRDFAGEMLDIYPDLRLLSVGSTYHRQNPGSDDITWFLLEKQVGRG